MSLPEHVARAVMALACQEEFVTLWRYFESQAEMLEREVLDPATDMATREILVRVLAMFRHEVVNLPKTAVKELEKQKPG